MAPDTQTTKGTGVEKLAATAAAQGKVWQDATDKIRTRTETTAKAVGALGTTAITAAGLSKFADIFPLPAWDDLSDAQGFAIAGVLGGLVLMAIAVLWLTARLWHVAQPIFMSPRLGRMKKELNPKDKRKGSPKDEYERVERIYGEAAALNEAESLEQYMLRGHRAERNAYAEPLDSPQGKVAAAEADQIRNDVIATMSRAATHIVRQRAHDAINSPRTVLLYALFVLGLLCFGVGADYLDSERSDRVAKAKACAEAVKAIRDADPETPAPVTAELLPELCGGKTAVPEAAEPSSPTPESETSGGASDIATRYGACIVAAEGDATRCTQLRAALDAVSQSGP
jgi:hypothetical protein